MFNLRTITRHTVKNISNIKASSCFSQSECAKYPTSSNTFLYQNGTRIRRFSYLKPPSSELEQETLMSEAEEQRVSEGIISKVNDQITARTHGRLFAVVFITGSQFLVTADDLLAVRKSFPPNIGDKIRFEKVLCVGGSDFTLYGRPLLPKDLVRAEATVVEKSLLSTRVVYKEMRGSVRYVREQYTVLRINSIAIDHPIDRLPSVEGVEGRTF